MLNIKDLIGAQQDPWVDLDKFINLCRERGINICKGERDNYTDGEVHYILKYKNNEYIVHSNYWDYNIVAWKKAIEWIFNQNN